MIQAAFRSYVAAVSMTFVSFVFADDPAKNAAPAAEAEQPAYTPEEQARFAKLAAMLTGAKLKGKFTVVGKPDLPTSDEEYTIVGAEKYSEKNFWTITARIKYGDKDVTVPMALPITWADDTAVISLDEFLIPGMGTFDCRVVLHDGKYAGTWRHGDVSGHLFGTIEKEKEKE
jgi:hypothetical protein